MNTGARKALGRLSATHAGGKTALLPIGLRSARLHQTATAATPSAPSGGQDVGPQPHVPHRAGGLGDVREVDDEHSSLRTTPSRGWELIVPAAGCSPRRGATSHGSRAGERGGGAGPRTSRP